MARGFVESALTATLERATARALVRTNVPLPGFVGSGDGPLELRGVVDLASRVCEFADPVVVRIAGGVTRVADPQAPGEWIESSHADPDAATVGQPVGLIEALLGLTEARAADGGRHFDCTVDLVEADARSAAGLTAPLLTVAELRAVELVARLTGDGLIEAVELELGQAWSGLELSEHGGPPRITGISAEPGPRHPVTPRTDGSAGGLAHVRSVLDRLRSSGGTSFRAVFTRDAYPPLEDPGTGPARVEGEIDFSSSTLELNAPLDPSDPSFLQAAPERVPWLFDLLEGLVRAEAAGEDPVGGIAATRYDACADVVVADDRLSGTIGIPPGNSIRSLRALPVSVWIDSEGRLRRASTALVASTIDVELLDPHT